MIKYIITGVVAVVLLIFVNCTNNEFNQIDQTGVIFDDAECLDAHCETFRVTQNGYNPLEYNKTDILFVFDNSPSMESENNRIADKMQGFLDGLNEKDVDYNLCYTMSEPSIYKEGRILNWSNGEKVLTNKTSQLNQIFDSTINQINENTSQTDQEQPIAATTYVLENSENSDCIRKNTAINVIFLTDEDEKSCGAACGLGYRNQPSTLESIANKQLGEVPFMVHSIIATKFYCYTDPSEPATNAVTLSNMSTLTNGIIGDLCADSYTEDLSKISSKINVTLESIALRCTPISPIQVVSTDNITYTTVIKYGRVFLTPGIRANSTVQITYDCKK